MKKLFIVMVSVVFIFASGFAAGTADRDVILEGLRTQIQANGWDFTVGHNPACAYSIEQLCTFKPDLAYTNFAIAEQPRDEKISRVRELPSYFMGYCGPVTSSGACGSAWAFASVGAVEGAFAYQASITINLSEQQLIDCNTLGYGCNGGFFYFDNALNPGLTTESNYPYVAYDKDCTVTAPYYPVCCAYYVDTASSVPTVDEIKQAIYDYGNVAAAVYANNAFLYYTGGTFSNCQNKYPNTTVILCGWDDSRGAWRLKNFWGTGWGEGGFMWIKYGCSKVGYAACYVIY